MRRNKKAIRIIAFLMVITLCLTGCTPEFKEALYEGWVVQFETVQKPQIIALWEQIKGKISAQLPKTGNFAQEEATESTPPTADTSVQEETKESSSWQDRFEDSKVSATVIPDEVEIRYHAKGATNVPEAHVISFNKLFSSKRISKTYPVKPGYVFLGWGTTKDATEVAYQPGDKYDKRESVLLYAVWEECTHKNADGELYGFNLEFEGETRCTQCNGELPSDLYYFSDYLRATQPRRKQNFKNLKEEELSEALADYLDRKGHWYQGLLDDLNISDENAGLLLEELGDIGEVLDQINSFFMTLYADKDMRNSLVNRNDFWYSYYFENITFYIRTFKLVFWSTPKTLRSMIAFGNSCNEYDAEVLKGISNTYRIQMQKIESGIQFATAASSAVGFLRSLAGFKSVSPLVPSPKDFQPLIENFKFETVSDTIWKSLHSGIYVKSGDEAVLAKAFNSSKEGVQVKTECWPYGPTSEQTIAYISQFDEDDAALPSWFFYLGWRIEYECAKKGAEMIQMVLDDKI